MKTKNCSTLFVVGVLLGLALSVIQTSASGSIYFNGATNYLLFSGPFFGGGEQYPFTFEFWFKPNSNSGQTLYVKNGSHSASEGALQNLTIQTTSDGRIAVYPAYEYVGSGNTISAPNLINSGQWQHIAVVLEPGFPFAEQYGGPGQGPQWPLLTVYLNGSQIITNQQIGSNGHINWDLLGDAPINGFGLNVDLMGQNYNNWFSGSIGEFRIWKRGLSSAEIQSKMNQILNPTNETGLFGYWRFSEGESNVVHDLVGTNNGIIFGASWSSELPNGAFLPPSITQQPSNQSVQIGTSNIVLSAGVSGSQPLAYQWLFNGSNITGATTKTLTIPKVRLQDMGAYSIVVTNMVGSVSSSNAFLSIYPFLISPFLGATVLWGHDAVLTASAAGTGPFSYQWYVNGLPIDGATDQTFTIPAIQFTNAGFYSVVISSSVGSVTNTPAQIVVNPAGVQLGMYPGIIITGTVGYAYSIQSTPDLLNTNGWLTLTNLTLQEPEFLWFDSSANANNPSNSRRFYRVVPQ